MSDERIAVLITITVIFLILVWVPCLLVGARCLRGMASTLKGPQRVGSNEADSYSHRVQQ